MNKDTYVAYIMMGKTRFLVNWHERVPYFPLPAFVFHLRNVIWPVCTTLYVSETVHVPSRNVSMFDLYFI